PDAGIAVRSPAALVRVAEQPCQSGWEAAGTGFDGDQLPVLGVEEEPPQRERELGVLPVGVQGVPHRIADVLEGHAAVPLAGRGIGMGRSEQVQNVDQNLDLRGRSDDNTDTPDQSYVTILVRYTM